MKHVTEMFEPKVALYTVPSHLKMLREDLCMAQSLLKGRGTWARLQTVIDQIDCYRPLGPDGKHGDRHTVRCGCEDK